jgi:hypothetical protein
MEWIVKLCKWVLRSSLARRGVEKVAIGRVMEAFVILKKLRDELSIVAYKMDKLGKYKENAIYTNKRRTDFEPSFDPIEELVMNFRNFWRINKTLDNYRKDFNPMELPYRVRILWDEIDTITKFWFCYENSIFVPQASVKHGAVVDYSLYLGGKQFYDLWEKDLDFVIDKWDQIPPLHRMQYSCQAWGFLKDLSQQLTLKINLLEFELKNY